MNTSHCLGSLINLTAVGFRLSVFGDNWQSNAKVVVIKMVPPLKMAGNFT